MNINTPNKSVYNKLSDIYRNKENINSLRLAIRNTIYESDKYIKRSLFLYDNHLELIIYLLGVRNGFNVLSYSDFYKGETGSLDYKMSLNEVYDGFLTFNTITANTELFKMINFYSKTVQNFDILKVVNDMQSFFLKDFFKENFKPEKMIHKDRFFDIPLESWKHTDKGKEIINGLNIIDKDMSFNQVLKNLLTIQYENNPTLRLEALLRIILLDKEKIKMKGDIRMEKLYLEESTIGGLLALQYLKEVTEENVKDLPSIDEIVNDRKSDQDESTETTIEFGTDESLKENILRMELSSILKSDNTYHAFNNIGKKLKESRIFDYDIINHKLLEVTLDKRPVGYIYETTKNTLVYTNGNIRRNIGKSNGVLDYNKILENFNTINCVFYNGQVTLDENIGRTVATGINKAVKITNKISDYLDRGINGVAKFAKDLYVGGKDDREEIIMDKLPAISKIFKLCLVNLAAWGINPFLGVVSAIVTLCMQAKVRRRERNKLLRELKNELEIVEEKLRDAESSGDRKAKYNLIRIRQKMKSEIERIRYSWARDEARDIDQDSDNND